MHLLRLTATALAAAALLLALAACGDGEETTVTVQETVEDSVDDVTTGGPPETTVTEPAEGGEGDHGPRYFQTPSGNIGCYVDATAARCDIRERDWKPTPPPQPCELDYGQGIAVGATHAEFICAGDTALGGPHTLGYGQSSQRGAFLCESETDGITCSHTGNGHGFFLSRQSFRIF